MVIAWMARTPAKKPATAKPAPAPKPRAVTRDPTHHEIRTMPIAQLEGAAYNPRRISERAMAGLQESLTRFGLVQPIVFNERTKRIVGGHQRVAALKAQGRAEASVLVVSLPETEEKALNLALNSHAIEGEWLPVEAGELLKEIEASNPELFGALRLDDLMESLEGSIARALKAAAGDDDEEVSEPEGPCRVQPGDMWVLGSHRLLCGDSTNPQHVSRVLDGATPELMITDPPYGVEYDPEWRKRSGLQDGGAYGKVTNDDRADWSDTYALSPAKVAYVWHPSLRTREFVESLERNAYELRAIIIWAKSNLQISRGHYHWQHEPCLYMVRDGETATWIGDRKQSTVWAIDVVRSKSGEERTNHSTQKPIECYLRPLRNHSGDVYEPFSGSGTAIVAAEKMRRRCYAIELEPKYCDMAIARWEKASGKTAERVSEG